MTASVGKRPALNYSVVLKNTSQVSSATLSSRADGDEKLYFTVNQTGGVGYQAELYENDLVFWKRNTPSSEWMRCWSITPGGGRRVKFWHNQYDMSLTYLDQSGLNGKGIRFNASGTITYNNLTNGNWSVIWNK